MRKPHEPTEAYKRETRRKKDLAWGDLWIVRGRRRHDGKEGFSSRKRERKEWRRRGRGAAAGAEDAGEEREEGTRSPHLYPHADLKAPT
jgi:hypothetical protein